MLAGMYPNSLGDFSTSLQLAGEGTEEEHVASSGLGSEEEERSGKGAEPEVRGGGGHLGRLALSEQPLTNRLIGCCQA